MICMKDHARCIILRDSLVDSTLPGPLERHMTANHWHWLGGIRLVEVLELTLPHPMAGEAASLLAAALQPHHYYAHIVDGDRLAVVFPGRVEWVRQGDREAMDRLRAIGVTYGILEDQMPFEGLFDRDHPHRRPDSPSPMPPRQTFRPTGLDAQDPCLCGRVLDISVAPDSLLVTLLSDGQHVSVQFPAGPPPVVNDIIGVIVRSGTIATAALRAVRWGVLTPTRLPGAAAQPLRENALLRDSGLRGSVVIRGKVLEAVRAFFVQQGFLEVETPILLPVRDIAPVDHFGVHATRADYDLGVLRICPENRLKRLVVAGYDRVFEIAKSFRDESPDDWHLPEFTSLECYQAYADYTDMEALCQGLLCRAALDATGTTVVHLGGKTIDLAAPWQRIHFNEAAREIADIDLTAHTETASLAAALSRRGVPCVGGSSRRELLQMLTSHLIEPGLPDACLLLDYPCETICVAKRHDDRPEQIERFEAFIGGHEIAHAFSELTDSQEQRQRMNMLLAEKREQSGQGHPLDEDFLSALDLGLPPTAGLGIGLDRLTMLLTGEPIHRVVFFPR